MGARCYKTLDIAASRTVTLPPRRSQDDGVKDTEQIKGDERQEGEVEGVARFRMSRRHQKGRARA